MSLMDEDLAKNPVASKKISLTFMFCYIQLNLVLHELRVGCTRAKRPADTQTFIESTLISILARMNCGKTRSSH